MNKENNIIIAIVVIVLVIILFSGIGMMGFGVFGGYGMMGRSYSMMSGFYGGFGAMWIFGWLIMMLGVIALILFILWLFKELNNKGGKR
jgi:glucan phosphoethanolaminetransferase (alkaline phosphatase superfamily)